MSGNSNVGNSQVYEDGDQKNAPQSKAEEEKKDARFHEGKENSHKANDSSKWLPSSIRWAWADLSPLRGRKNHCQQARSRGEGTLHQVDSRQEYNLAEG